MQRELWFATILLIAGLSGCISPAPDPEDSPLMAGIFDPQPVSQPRFDIQPPDEDPALQRHMVVASDGVELFVETWLPLSPESGEPLDSIPTILLLSPYRTQGVLAQGYHADDYVKHGFAWAQAHVRGTGISGGCLDLRSPQDQDDALRIIEYLGRDAPWSNGKVGMAGHSYQGGTQAQAITSDDHERKQYLATVVIGAPAISTYEESFIDGVPKLAVSEIIWPSYAYYDATDGEIQNETISPNHQDCGADNTRSATEGDGDVTPFYQIRDARTQVANVDVAVLYFHGLIESRVTGIQGVGFFDELPDDVHKVGLFGVFDHEYPDHFNFNEGDPFYESERLEWERSDWLDMTVAWYDYYLKGLDTGALEWPTVQVQGMDGNWRVEADWPKTGGPVGQLSLDAGGMLGTTQPTGTTSYVESTYEVDDVEWSAPLIAAFETGPLTDRLELTGQPMIDLWVSVDRPDAHLTAKLEAFNENGELVIPEARAVAARSIRHIEPLHDNRFWQFEAQDPPLNTPIHVELRFNPTDLVIPEGGSLRVTFAGSTRHFDGLDAFAQGAGSGVGGPTEPSGSSTLITIHHNCENPSILRFLMPDERPERLSVGEKRYGGELAAPARDIVSSDGGGIATAKVCGEGPIRNDILGPAKDP